MILILGVTASGKGRLAFELARALDGEIVSVDSMKVYRRMDIGTAKPPAQARRQVPYHLIDVVEPSESFSVGLYLEKALPAIEEIRRRGRTAIAVGGTALYIKALLYGLFEGPGSNEQIRAELRSRAEAEGLACLHAELARLDPEAADRINPNARAGPYRASSGSSRPSDRFMTGCLSDCDATRPWRAAASMPGSGRCSRRAWSMRSSRCWPRTNP